ncbi:MAG: DNA mismatch endonuclease Vsr [Flavobacteriales bacterium]|nr:DNA mismatch endonuclease Vsr [Flavobacteriales bacterium]
MVDVHTPEVRSKNMKAIRSKNTKSELYVRHVLHSYGFRFRIHPSSLPSRPDIYLAKYHAVIWIHGCFWHGHDCHLFKWPKTNVVFWRDKILTNRARDVAKARELCEIGIKLLIVWECALEGKVRLSEDELFERLEEWLLFIDHNCELSGEGLSSLTF